VGKGVQGQDEVEVLTQAAVFSGISCYTITAEIIVFTCAIPTILAWIPSTKASICDRESNIY